LEGACPSIGRGCGGQKPQSGGLWSVCEGETAACQNEEGKLLNGIDPKIAFQEAVTFLEARAEGVSRISLRSDHLLYLCYVIAFTVQRLPV
jgi:hypothetical protein